MTSKTSYIYIIGTDNGPFKIGFSDNPDKRLVQLQTGYPEKLNVQYTCEIPRNIIKVVESLIHKNLVRSKILGEWFDVSLDVAKSEVDFAMIRYVDYGDSLRGLAKDRQWAQK